MGLSCSRCYRKKRKCDKPLYGSCTRCVRTSLANQCTAGWEQSMKLAKGIAAKRIATVSKLSQNENERDIYDTSNAFMIAWLGEGDYDPVEFLSRNEFNK